MRRSGLTLVVACALAAFGDRVPAAESSLGTASPEQLSVPTALGTFRAEMGIAPDGEGGLARLQLEGRPEVLEIVAVPAENPLGEVRVEVRYDRFGTIHYLLGRDGPVLLESGVRDCAVLDGLEVVRAATTASRAMADRLAIGGGPVTSVDGPPRTLAFLAALAVIAPSLSKECRDRWESVVPAGCLDYGWEEDCADCCRMGRAVTDVGAVFCGALGAMFCAPGVVAAGLCSGVAAVTCQRIGELAERGCIRACGRLPKLPSEGRACGASQSGICADSCGGTVIPGDCSPGLVCCTEAPLPWTLAE